ncbi:efflux transporter outer membrane subunit [Maritimibacter sp. 55A14]|uniref:efflux transporter outer membrane subunit n=1 Tax=Maritimibacter sp. 55A14 TaxID=2174844 RepID=UPI001304FE25|nr:efflux transporter outer membrane subunit [Maritimibacter sp. 55A14]
MGLSLTLSACSRDIDYDAPVFPFMSSYKAARSGAPVLLTNADWWKTLKDPTLNALVDTALSGNLDIELAKERLVEARENVGAVPGEAELEPEARAQVEGGSAVRDDEGAEASLGLSWLLDIYGARYRRVEAARARAAAADAEVNAARLLLLSSMANAYIDLRFNQRSLQLRQRQLQSRLQSLDLTRRLFEQDAVTRLDIVRTEALVTETRAQIPPLRAAVESSKYRIAVLAGVTPGRLGVDLDSGARQLRPTMSPEIGIPPDLLRNRPDIFIAEREYYAAVAEVGVVRADLYPQLTLSGLITLTSIGGASGTAYQAGPAVTFPSLFSGDTRAATRAAESRARQAYTRWKRTVLEAVLDVETALAGYSGNRASVQASQRTARLFREASDLTRELIISGGATVLDLVDAEQSVATADIALATTLRDLARSYVEVNVNLGSGHNLGKVTPTENPD